MPQEMERVVRQANKSCGAVFKKEEFSKGKRIILNFRAKKKPK